MQDIIVISIAAIAGLYALRWTWRRLSGRGGCGCGHAVCSSAAAPRAQVSGSVRSLTVVR